MSDRVQLRVGTTADATTANDTLLRDTGGAEIALTDDRTTHVGNVRGWLADGADFTTLHTAQSRGIWATPGDLAADIAALTYYSPGGTDVAVADGGTGASSASAARTNLGLVIGTDVEAHDTDLTTIAGLSPTDDDVLQRKSGAWTNRTLTQLKADLAVTDPVAALHNLKAQTFDAAAATLNISLTSGTLQITAVYVPTAFTCASIWLVVDAAGVSLTNVGVGLWAFGATGSLLASSVNTNGATTTAFQSTGAKQITFSGQALTAGTWYYVGVWTTGGTAPKMTRGTNSAPNVGIASAPFRFATANGSLTTSAPANLASQASSNAMWAGLAI